MFSWLLAEDLMFPNLLSNFNSASWKLAVNETSARSASNGIGDAIGRDCSNYRGTRSTVAHGGGNHQFTRVGACLVRPSSQAGQGGIAIARVLAERGKDSPRGPRPRLPTATTTARHTTHAARYRPHGGANISNKR